MDKACAFWAGILHPYMSPESPELSEHGLHTITALLRACPRGLPLTRAVGHKVQAWRESAEGTETIAHALDLSDEEVHLVDMRQVVSGTDEHGQRLSPNEDMLVTLFDMVNMAEIERGQRSKEVEEASADE